MHMPLCWLLLHSYCWKELVKSTWSKCMRPYTWGVYIFIRNAHVHSFVLSIHFFHSRKSQHIWHPSPSARYHLQWAPRGFPTWSWWIPNTGKKNVRGKAWFSFILLLTWKIIPRLFPCLPDVGAPVPSWLCSSHCASPLSVHHRGCDSRQGQG